MHLVLLLLGGECHVVRLDLCELEGHCLGNRKRRWRFDIKPLQDAHSLRAQPRFRAMRDGRQRVHAALFDQLVSCIGLIGEVAQSCGGVSLGLWIACQQLDER